MFTGLVSAVGRIVDAQPLGDDTSHGKRLIVEAPPGWLDGAQRGDSIALDGACMTVTAIEGDRFVVDISTESLARTDGLDRAGTRINLEQALRAGDRLGGHMVSGHVDGVGTVRRFEAVGESHRLVVRAPRALARYLAFKGSIAVDGVSLTINRVDDTDDGSDIEINVIPHTLAHTTLGDLSVGARVNLEVDTIARYVERMVSVR